MSLDYIKETITDALTSACITSSAILTKLQAASGDDTPWEPTITEQEHACQGWVDTYDAADLDGSNVQSNDRKVYVLVSSLAATPTPADTLTIDNNTFSVISVQLDAAGACWVLQARL